MGFFRWYYRLGGMPEVGVIDISISFSPRRDRAHVRGLLRIRSNVDRLPNGTQVWPEDSPEGQQLMQQLRWQRSLSKRKARTKP